MAYDEKLAARLRTLLAGRSGLTEKKMFGGLAFFINGNMAVGVLKDEMVVKYLRERESALLARPGARPFDFTGKPMSGILLVHPSALAGEDDLAEWIEPGLAAAASKPPKTKKARPKK